jgi:thymidylate synthase
MHYNPKYKPNQLIYGTGDNLVIVTGWTPKEAIAKKLASKEYAAIGNLYSPSRGINFLIRNLLLNPQITQLRILSVTREDQNSGSCKCLFNFFKHGITQVNDRWAINSDIKGYLDIEITKEALEELRASIKVNYQSMDILEKIEPTINSRRYYEFETKENITEIKPSNIYGHTITGKTIADTWVSIIHRIRQNGTIRPTGYDGEWQELIDLKAIITDEPIDFYFPEPNYLPVDRKYIQNYLPQILEDSPYKEGVKYTYGQRLRSWFGSDQIQKVIDKLKKEKDSASAVMNLWDSGSGSERNTIKVIDDCGMPETVPYQLVRYGRNAGDSDHEHGGSPCLNHIWVRIIDNKLSMTATFRSNDMFSAWVANAIGLRALQSYVRNEIDKDLELAPLITISQSAHIYDDCFENADNLIETQYYGNKKITYSDPVGNFIIEYDQEIKYKEKIKVLHLDQHDNLIKEYYGETPLFLIRAIAKDNPSIAPLHIGYLGLELQKASEKKAEYMQDV